MSKDVTVTVHGDRAEMFQEVFGTTTVCVENAVGEIANLPGLGVRHVYKLDLAEITAEQREKLIINLAGRFGMSKSEVRALLVTHGVPILAEDCTMTCSGDTARRLMADAMDVIYISDDPLSPDYLPREEDVDWDWYDDEYDDPLEDDWRDYDPNRCPVCGGDLTVDGDYAFCGDIECGYSEYIGDGNEDEPGTVTNNLPPDDDIPF